LDEKTFNERVARIKAVNDAIKELDPAVRSAAFSLLEVYVTGSSDDEKPKTPTKPSAAPTDGEEHDEDIATFFATRDTTKPSDAIRVIAAYHYAQYGNESFTLDYVRETANAVGLTIPTQPNKTIVTAAEKGKKIFTSKGRNQYSPTVHGEAFFKETYKVIKGKKPKPAESPA
jgi:hypothetical protein